MYADRDKTSTDSGQKTDAETDRTYAAIPVEHGDFFAIYLPPDQHQLCTRVSVSHLVIDGLRLRPFAAAYGFEGGRHYGHLADEQTGYVGMTHSEKSSGAISAGDTSERIVVEVVSK